MKDIQRFYEFRSVASKEDLFLFKIILNSTNCSIKSAINGVYGIRNINNSKKTDHYNKKKSM